MRVLSKGPCLAAVLWLCAAALVPLHGVPRWASSAADPDTARLRQALADALGDDFEIVRTELSTGLRERGGTFWLVHARPRRSGYYALDYRYEYKDHHRPENPLYTHVEHASVIRVGERGCWRRREGKDVCLGDTIILPFVVNDYTGHTFRVVRSALPPDESFPAPPLLADTTGLDAVANPLAAHLRLLGTHSGERLRRNGGGWIIYSATLEAVAPGRFNLSLSSHSLQDLSLKAAISSIPVIIVPRGQPVTVLLEKEYVVGRDETHGFSSHSGNEYLTTPLLLQPGDRITLEYGTRALPGPDYPRPAALQSSTVPAADPVPVIAGFPFQLDVERRFNAWIADHLPVAP